MKTEKQIMNRIKYYMESISMQEDLETDNFIIDNQKLLERIKALKWVISAK